MTTLAWYQWMALTALGICLVTLILHFFRLISLGKPKDLSRPSGNVAQGIFYAFTGAMSPARKESAYLHLPTYTAGILYHLGTFLSMFLFFFILSGIYPQGWLAWAIIAFLVISSLSGTAILIRRIIRKKLRYLSNPDDFISNFMVTLFQVLSIIFLLSLPVFQSSSLPIFKSSNLQIFPSSRPTVQLLYYLEYTLLMLYIPIGKLRHTVYFFAARYHLGFFFGRRGVWPAGKVKS